MMKNSLRRQQPDENLVKKILKRTHPPRTREGS